MGEEGKGGFDPSRTEARQLLLWYSFGKRSWSGVIACEVELRCLEFLSVSDLCDSAEAVRFAFTKQ